MTWTFSHSQLSTYRDCPRLYFDRYVLGHKEPKTPAMAFGTWMLHGPIEDWIKNGGHDALCKIYGYENEPGWELYWANFLAEFGGSDDFDDPIYTIKTAKKCLELYKKHPIEGQVRAVERRNLYTFPDGIQYVSIPDFVVDQSIYTGVEHVQTFTVDLKFTTSWKPSPLLPYDDQCLGQAICSGADGFIRMTFQGDKKSGKVTGPYIEDHLVDPVLKAQWLEETWATCREIESWKAKTHATWPKNDGHCFRYGMDRPCYRMNFCKNGGTPL